MPTITKKLPSVGRLPDYIRREIHMLMSSVLLSNEFTVRDAAHYIKSIYDLKDGVNTIMSFWRRYNYEKDEIVIYDSNRKQWVMKHKNRSIGNYQNVAMQPSKIAKKYLNTQTRFTMPRTKVELPFNDTQALNFQKFMADKVMSGTRVMDALGDARVDLDLRRYTVLTLKDFYYQINKTYGPIVKWDKHTKSWSRIDRDIAAPTTKKVKGSNAVPTSIKDTVQGETLDLSKVSRGNDLAYLEIKLGDAEIRIQFNVD